MIQTAHVVFDYFLLQKLPLSKLLKIVLFKNFLCKAALVRIAKCDILPTRSSQYRDNRYPHHNCSADPFDINWLYNVEMEQESKRQVILYS